MAEPKTRPMVEITAVTEIHLGKPTRVIKSGSTALVTVEQADDLVAVGAAKLVTQPSE